MVTTKKPRSHTSVIFLSMFMLGGLWLAPIASHADNTTTQADSDKKGPEIPIKVGDPIIIPDKKAPKK